MERMRGIRARISRADSARRLSAAGIDVFFGEARFTRTDALTVDGATLRFKKALIATGARPRHARDSRPRRSRLSDQRERLRSDRVPRRLLVIGGGPLGCELAQAFCRFGRADHHRAETAAVPAQGGARRRADLVRCLRARWHRGSAQHPGRQRARRRRRRRSSISVSDDYHSTVVGRCHPRRHRPGAECRRAESRSRRRRLRHRATASTSTTFCRPAIARIYAAGDVCLEHKFTHTADASARIVVRTRCSSAASG